MDNFSGLSALYINCTLKRSPLISHTAGLMKTSAEIMRSHDVEVTEIRAVDHSIATGIKPDMTEHGWDEDAWPELMKQVLKADILVLGTPIWLGERSSICSKVIERLYSWSGKTNDSGQSIFYGRTAGCIITGNEDGVKHCSMSILYSLSHLGYVIPPQADSGWIGEIGPGPSYLDPGSGGPENDFTRTNTRIMTWNLMHIAAWLKSNKGFPVKGNTRE